MANEEVDIGIASKVTLDVLVRQMVKEIFSKDRDTMVMSVCLDETRDSPVVEFEFKLISINGVYPNEGSKA